MHDGDDYERIDNDDDDVNLDMILSGMVSSTFSSNTPPTPDLGILTRVKE